MKNRQHFELSIHNNNIIIIGSEIGAEIKFAASFLNFLLLFFHIFAILESGGKYGKMEGGRRAQEIDCLAKSD